MKECENYLTGFCCKDLDGGRVWDCTAPNKLMRFLEQKKVKKSVFYSCKYPKIGKKNER
jgi:hypothetical protein